MGGKLWALFVYLSTQDKLRREQWEMLLIRKASWEDRWVLGGDLNDIRYPIEKHRGRLRTEHSCQGFRDFTATMDMEKIGFQRKPWTWANNWADEGYIEPRLDRFFASSLWLLEHNSIMVKHIER